MSEGRLSVLGCPRCGLANGIFVEQPCPFGHGCLWQGIDHLHKTCRCGHRWIEEVDPNIEYEP